MEVSRYREDIDCYKQKHFIKRFKIINNQ